MPESPKHQPYTTWFRLGLSMFCLFLVSFAFAQTDSTEFVAPEDDTFIYYDTVFVPGDTIYKIDTTFIDVYPITNLTLDVYGGFFSPFLTDVQTPGIAAPAFETDSLPYGVKDSIWGLSETLTLQTGQHYGMSFTANRKGLTMQLGFSRSHFQEEYEGTMEKLATLPVEVRDTLSEIISEDPVTGVRTIIYIVEIYDDTVDVLLPNHMNTLLKSSEFNLYFFGGSRIIDGYKFDLHLLGGMAMSFIERSQGNIYSMENPVIVPYERQYNTKNMNLSAILKFRGTLSLTDRLGLVVEPWARWGFRTELLNDHRRTRTTKFYGSNFGLFFEF